MESHFILLQCELSKPLLSNKELRRICDESMSIGCMFHRGKWRVMYQDIDAQKLGEVTLREKLEPLGYSVIQPVTSMNQTKVYTPSSSTITTTTSSASSAAGSGEEKLTPSLAKSYVSTAPLGSQEELHFKAAGIICWRRRKNAREAFDIDVLLGLERRKGEAGRVVLSALAGKREKEDVDSADTAVREFWEESGMLYDSEWKKGALELLRKKPNNDDDIVTKLKEMTLSSSRLSSLSNEGIKSIWVQRAKMVLYMMEDITFLPPTDDIVTLHAEKAKQREEEKMHGRGDKFDVMLGLRWVSLRALLSVDRHGPGLLSSDACGCSKTSIGVDDGFLPLGKFAKELFCVNENGVRRAMESTLKEVRPK
jgi:hypothetical protein